jgi:hypothetical protein
MVYDRKSERIKNSPHCGEFFMRRTLFNDIGRVGKNCEAIFSNTPNIKKED